MRIKNQIQIKKNRSLRKKLAKKQKVRAILKNRSYEYAEIPTVHHIDDFSVESFKSYFARWPKRLGNIPKDVVEQWVYRHNESFLEMWSSFKPERWSFRRTKLTTKQFLEISHLPGEVNHYESVGIRCINQTPATEYVANYMLKNGTFPKPIIVATAATHLIHPRGKQFNEYMTMNQLIEGHRRLGLLRAMCLANKRLKLKHDIWIMRFNV